MSDDAQFQSKLNPSIHIAGQVERRPSRRSDKPVRSLTAEVIALVGKYPTRERVLALIERIDREGLDIQEETLQKLIDHLDKSVREIDRLAAALEVRTQAVIEKAAEREARAAQARLDPFFQAPIVVAQGPLAKGSRRRQPSRSDTDGPAE
jgi:hypothetical protein